MPAKPKITPAKLAEAIAAFRIGADDAGAAHLIGVSKRGLQKYFERHPAADREMRDAKEIADDRVQGRLFKEAVNGNVTAMIFWLKNRRSKEWRDRRELGIGTVGDVSDAISKAHADAVKGTLPEVEDAPSESTARELEMLSDEARDAERDS